MESLKLCIWYLQNRTDVQRRFLKPEQEIWANARETRESL